MGTQLLMVYGSWSSVKAKNTLVVSEKEKRGRFRGRIFLSLYL